MVLGEDGVFFTIFMLDFGHQIIWNEKSNLIRFLIYQGLAFLQNLES